MITQGLDVLASLEKVGLLPARVPARFDFLGFKALG
jgi:hypothetical protein